MRILLLLALLPAIAHGLQWDQVRIVPEAPDCEFVKQETCNTKRANGQARCIKWVKKRAARNGADTAVLLSSDTDKRMFTAFGNLFTGGATTVLADYYRCAKEE